jgi:hypothetical protein
MADNLNEGWGQMGLTQHGYTLRCWSALAAGGVASPKARGWPAPGDIQIMFDKAGRPTSGPKFGPAFAIKA